jgi:hypothetical protein
MDGNIFADDEEFETEVRKWLRQQSKDFYAAGFRHTGKTMGQVHQCWWRICREINVLFFQVRISHVLRFISICGLFTDLPSSFQKISKHEMSILFGLYTGNFVK